MAIRIDGKAIAAEMRAEMKLRADALKARGVVPCLAVILAGDDPASKIYVRNKKRACEEIGILSKEVLLPGDISEDALICEIRALNEDAGVHAILVQLPLPKHINALRALDEISPEKDADGFHVVNAGKLFTGRETVLPCTPAGCMELIDRAGVSVAGKRAVVIGRSNIVGKPMALLLLKANATVTMCHSKTENLSDITRQADILVSAVGRAYTVTADMVKEGACVIDVGMNRIDGKLMGDVDYAEVEKVAGAITPVPGGVGPMTIAMLMQNALDAAERQNAR